MWKKFYSNGSNHKLKDNDYLVAYINDAGYIIHLIYETPRHAKVVGYDLRDSKGQSLCLSRLLSEVKDFYNKNCA